MGERFSPYWSPVMNHLEALRKDLIKQVQWQMYTRCPNWKRVDFSNHSIMREAFDLGKDTFLIETLCTWLDCLDEYGGVKFID